MDEDGLRDLLSKRLYIELQLFRDSMLQKEKEEILACAYTAEVYTDLYEILIEDIGVLDAGAMRRLLSLDRGILESLYWEWMLKEDSFMEELGEHARSGLEALSRPASGTGREAQDGTGTDKAA